MRIIKEHAVSSTRYLCYNLKLSIEFYEDNGKEISLFNTLLEGETPYYIVYI